MENLERRSHELRHNCGETIDESITEPSIVHHAFSASIKMGPFAATALRVKSSDVALGVTAMDEFEVRSQRHQNCALRAATVVYFSSLNGIMEIKVERNRHVRELEFLSSYTPLGLVKLSTADFVRLVF